jgi:uncharacterized RDD family membrane protein YckC
MGTALDTVLEDKRAQEFWLRRFIAIIIDMLILWLPIIAISSFTWRIGVFGQVPWFIAGVLTILYSAFFEAELGYTIGKRVMNLEVVSLDGRPYDLQRGLIRNFSKIHVILLVLDLLGGLLAENRTNMRYLDTVVKCEVVDAQVAEWRRSQGLTPMPARSEAEAGVVVQTGDRAPEPTMPPEPDIEPPEETDELQEVPEEVEPLEEVEEEPEDKAPGIAPPPMPAYHMEPPEEKKEEEGASEWEEEEELPPEEKKEEGGASEWEEETTTDEEKED